MWGQKYISSACEQSNHLCEIDYTIPLEDNFSKNYLDLITIPINIFVISIVKTLFKKSKISDKGLMYVNYISLFYILTYTLFVTTKVVYFEKEICGFPISCHEGLNDTILTSNYYYQMDNCPKYPDWIINNYDNTIDKKVHDCIDSEYGCCEIDDIGCSYEISNSVSKYSEYSNFMESYNGSWLIPIERNDKTGSQCPTIEDIIYEISKNRMDDQYCFYLLVYIFIMVLIYMNHHKCDQYQETNSDIELSNTNDVLIGSV